MNFNIEITRKSHKKFAHLAFHCQEAKRDKQNSDKNENQLRENKVPSYEGVKNETRSEPVCLEVNMAAVLLSFILEQQCAAAAAAGLTQCSSVVCQFS